MKHVAVAVLLGVAAAACASRGDVETMGDALRDEIAVLAEGQLRLAEAVQADLESIESSSQRRETTGRGELERLIGRVEDLFEQIIEMSAQNNQLLNDIYENQRRQGSPSPMGFPGPADAGPPAAGPPATESNPAAGSGSDVASQVYAMALDMYQRGNLETARDAFREFLAVYGGHEFAPDAQYWVARTYEDAQDPGSALEEYRRLTELYPDSSRAPAALFRRAMIEAGRGNTAVARRLFVQIESGYPNSPEAPEARRERERLGG
ncbi:MAG: tetratricopeptide repeat protein [Gemmatimonadota bacterium]|uniref:tetratricopeptide repeat protein n=1 Tax=Candidatus Palauibacter scopulicola TaxID=3056741 RepID=UPI0023871DFF|nr:tetratricopeptide repeat protein [Candidatus Palauibacter scopulicola]MDE2662309.1 tetratricopeptide repeat protein [Candidatus Palauibacter scopulicola]